MTAIAMHAVSFEKIQALLDVKNWLLNFFDMLKPETEPVMPKEKFEQII